MLLDLTGSLAIDLSGGVNMLPATAWDADLVDKIVLFTAHHNSVLSNWPLAVSTQTEAEAEQIIKNMMGEEIPLAEDDNNMEFVANIAGNYGDDCGWGLYQPDIVEF
jgi:hypothetical protein